MEADALFGLTPYWKNFFEDKFSVQFIHRWTGTAAAGLLLLGWRAFSQMSARSSSNKMGVVWWVSVLIGGFHHSPDLGRISLLIHQLVALFLFAALLGRFIP